VHAIRWAADRHARVINLSLAGLGPVAGYKEAVDYALAHGALVVAAAGNCFDAHFARCIPTGFAQAAAIAA
jgi:subtilisin family serine protease